jgi:hypothetical protein
VSDAEEKHFDLVLRVSRERPRDDAVVDQLIRVGIFVRELWRALDRGENVGARVGALYRATTGRHDTTEARLMVVVAIQRVAQRTDAQIGAMLWGGDPRRVPTATDVQISMLVCMQIQQPRDAAKRLAEHPAAVASAVRKWRRGRGRPKVGEPAGSKWFAIAKVLGLAGLGNVDEKAVKQLWKEHGLKIG